MSMESELANGGDAEVTEKKRSKAGTVLGFPELMVSALEAANMSDVDPDPETGIVRELEKAAAKQCKKFYNDDRTRAKSSMGAAKAKALIHQFVDATMGAFQSVLWEKEDWLDKIGWDAILVMLTRWAFTETKVFSRIMSSDVEGIVQTGLLQWSEEDKLTKELYNALSSAGLAENHIKKAKLNLLNAYDDAHFYAPFGTTDNSEQLGQELATLQDFVKGWMQRFVELSYPSLEHGLDDNSTSSIVGAMVGIFQHLLDPNVAACPLALQAALPPAPWSFIQDTAQELVEEEEAKPKKKRRMN